MEITGHLHSPLGPPFQAPPSSHFHSSDGDKGCRPSVWVLGSPQNTPHAQGVLLGLHLKSNSLPSFYPEDISLKGQGNHAWVKFFHTNKIFEESIKTYFQDYYFKVRLYFPVPSVANPQTQQNSLKSTLQCFHWKKAIMQALSHWAAGIFLLKVWFSLYFSSCWPC